MNPRQIRSLSRSHAHPDFGEIQIQRDLRESVRLARKQMTEKPQYVPEVQAPPFHQNQATRLRINQVYNKRRSFSTCYTFDYKRACQELDQGRKLFYTTN